MVPPGPAEWRRACLPAARNSAPITAAGLIRDQPGCAASGNRDHAGLGEIRAAGHGEQRMNAERRDILLRPGPDRIREKVDAEPSQRGIEKQVGAEAGQAVMRESVAGLGIGANGRRPEFVDQRQVDRRRRAARRQRRTRPAAEAGDA